MLNLIFKILTLLLIFLDAKISIFSHIFILFYFFDRLFLFYFINT